MALSRLLDRVAAAPSGSPSCAGASRMAAASASTLPVCHDAGPAPCCPSRTVHISSAVGSDSGVVKSG